MNRMHRLLLRDVRYVIAPSNAVAESLRLQNIFPIEKIVTIRYGLDANRFGERGSVNRESLCVGSVGNFDPVKGFDVLIRAAATITKLKPGVKFRIVGEDRSRDRRNEKELRDLITELRLEETVELVGWSENISDVLAEFDIFVSASRSESFGFVIAEAMLTGVPVIATETEGAREIISDPTLGRLVPVGSVDVLADAILDLLGDEQKRNDLSKHGRDHVSSNFSLQRMVDETEALYKRTLGSS